MRCNNFRLENSIVLLFFMWICFVFRPADASVWKEVTACYGADNHCSQYALECTPGTKIVLGALMYGTKNGNQHCQLGISDCSKTDEVHACCAYNASDTFTPFSLDNFTTVQENCEGRTACAGWAPRRKTIPYSSYVWIQYTCVSETNMTDMCRTSTLVGNDLFIRFNSSNSKITASPATSVDCSCRISTPDCSVTMTTTFVDLDFRLPQLDASISSADTMSSACSSAALSLPENGKIYNCTNTQWYDDKPTFDRMTEISVSSAEEIVPLRNISGASGPNYIVLYFRTSPQRPLLINCFEPGKEPKLTNHCQITTPQQTAFELSSSASDGSSSAATPISETITTQIPTAIASTMSPSIKDIGTSTMKEPSTQSSSSASSPPPSSPPPPSSSTLSSSLSSSSSSQSSSVTSSKSILPYSSPSAENFTKRNTVTFSRSPKLSNGSSLGHLSTDNPSTSTPSHQSVRPQGVSASSTLLIRPDSKSTTITINQSSKYAQIKSTVPSKTDEKLSSARITSTVSAAIYSTNTSTSSVSDSSVRPSILTSVAPTVSSGKTIENVSATITIYQNENTNVEESTRATSESTTHDTEVTIDDGGNNNGLIIGVSVAVVLVFLIIVGLVMVCLCIRIKRKEKIRRNYVRNTNIFFSLPQDYNDNESTQSSYQPEVDTPEQSFTNIPRSKLYESVGNPSPSSTLSKANNPFYFDQYKIKAANEGEPNVVATDTFTYSVMPNDNNYVGETSNETIAFVNGTEDANAENTEGVENGGKSVSFDPSVHYAQVRKEGKTKF